MAHSIMLLPPAPRKRCTAFFRRDRFTSLYIEKDENGTSIVIQLVGDAVVYKIMAGGKMVESATLHPSADDWLNFIQGLNNAKVYKWAPKYEYPGQGISWVVDLAMDDRKLTSAGSNDYPREGAEAEPAAAPKAGPSIPFQLFWQAALTLAGKSPPPVSSK
jgi:hypothetical protein